VSNPGTTADVYIVTVLATPSAARQFRRSSWFSCSTFV
jgi:hypothetical protein